MKLILGTLIAALLFAIPVKAAPTAAQLSATCLDFDAYQKELNANKPTSASITGGVCLGYVSGWADGILGMQMTIKGKVVQVQFADDVSAGQIIHVFIKYVKDHPEIENKPAYAVLAMSMIDAKIMGLSPVAAEAQEQ
jgi:hypothetical protein